MDIKDLEVPDRRGSNSTKWDGLEGIFGDGDLLSMWVADMDFKAPPAVGQALRRTAEYNVYGYYLPGDGYYDAFIDWQRRRHGCEVRREWLRYSTGVVSGIFWTVDFMTRPGDACMILSPCYYPFMDAVVHTGRKLICCQLKEDQGRYSIDFDAFERQLAEHQVKLFILCSPHNPVGRVWTREELRTIMELCRKYHVFVISDEIHQDIILGPKPQVPTATVGDYSDMMLTLTAGSKTFNLAGAQNSYVIIPDDAIRARFDDYVKRIRVTRGSMFGYIAVEAAYRGGEEWLAAVLEAIRGNERFCRDHLAQNLPQAVVSPLEGTYLLWVDLAPYVPAGEIRDFMLHEARIAVDYGDQFFAPGHPADTHIRLNLATPRCNVERAMEQLASAAQKRLKK